MDDVSGRRGVEVHLGNCSRGTVSRDTTGVIRATGEAKSAISKPVPLPARGGICAVLHSPRIGGSDHRRFRVHVRGELVSVLSPSGGATSTLVELRLPTNIDVRVGIWKNTGVSGTVLKAGLKVSRMFTRGNSLIPIAIMRILPGIITNMGAIRASNCGTMRVKCNTIGRGRLAEPIGKRFRGTNVSPIGCLHRCELTRGPRCAINRALTTSVFTTNRFISMVNVDENGNFTNAVGH